MARNRERIRLEDGLKLDLNSLLRQETMRSGPVLCASISCGPRYFGDVTACGFLVLCLSSASRGSLWLQLGALKQSIDLVAAPRHFGGVQWYFVCSVLGRRASVLWMPPGATELACRQAWGGLVAYGSQFQAWQYRALSRAQDIRHQFGAENAASDFDDLPARPKGMHWKTYEAQLERLEVYRAKCDLYEGKLASRR